MDFGGVGGGGGGGPEQWFSNLPPVSRIWLGITLIITALVNLDILQWNDVEFVRWEDLIGRGSSGRVEAWRLLTCFLYAGKFSFHTIINLHLMTQITTRYEKMGPICTRRIHVNQQQPTREDGPAEEQTNDDNNNAQQRRRGQRYISPYYERGETSDYVFCLLFGIIGILLSHVFLLPKLPTSITHDRYHRFFHRHLTFYVVYIWSKQHANTRVDFFGVPFAAAYLPYAYLFMGYALNNQTIPPDILHGMFVGHVYFYLACVVPLVLGGRRALIYTPVALIDFCHWLEGYGPVIRGGNEGVAGGPVLVDVDGIIGG